METDENLNPDAKLHTFFPSLLCPPLDLIIIPKSQEDEAHNVQAVIDSLALDYLQVSLSHITGWYILIRQLCILLGRTLDIV